ncbi:MAG: hypothetical protein WC824_07830 [Bacteroidota bacterium]|jgi:hypothetical protein
MSLYTLGQLNLENRLIIFDRFREDKNLPKFREKKEKKGKFSSVSSAQVGTGNIVSPNESDEDMDEDPSSVSGNSRIVTWVGSTSKKAHGKLQHVPWYIRLFKREKKDQEPPEVPVEEVFTLVLKSPEELKIFEDRNQALEKMIEDSVTTGQEALHQQLLAEKDIRKIENALVASSHKRYISEAQLLKFSQWCQKGLCLDWISDFIRPIPPEVIQAKVECDKAGFFDNYVVLHFDPENRGTTEEARRKARDPILFGVLKGSRKLYFVGDWKDELCDLTFQQIVDKLGEGSLEFK